MAAAPPPGKKWYDDITYEINWGSDGRPDHVYIEIPHSATDKVIDADVGPGVADLLQCLIDKVQDNG